MAAFLTLVPTSASLSVSTDSVSVSPRSIWLSVKLEEGTLHNVDGDDLTQARWSIHVSEVLDSDPEDADPIDDIVVGTMKYRTHRLSPSLNISVEMAKTKFQSLLDALMRGKAPSAIEVTIDDGMSEQRGAFTWNEPTDEPLTLSSIEFTIPLLP